MCPEQALGIVFGAYEAHKAAKRGHVAVVTGMEHSKFPLYFSSFIVTTGV